MAANMKAMRTIEIVTSTTVRKTAAAGKVSLRNLPSACRAALVTRDTVIRKPDVATNPRLAARACAKREKVERWLVPVAFQMAFKADWTSPNTLVADTIRAPMPTIVAQVPLSRLPTFLTIAPRASPVDLPIRSPSWPTMACSAASRPNTWAAMVMMISRTGATANSV